ncbi:MAG TPA: hypothetical protein VFH58_11870 [Acidimicrobiales bacterium]|nr:hypothetical protein [Acidimicrobiales bacterium]
MNFKGFKPIDWTIVATGVLSFIALFLPWWGVSFEGYGASVNGWNTSYGWFGALLVVGAAAWYVLARAGVGAARLEGTQAAGTAGVTILGFVIVLIRWITLPRGNAYGRAFHYGGRAGIWIAAIAAAVQVAAMVVLFRQSGEPMPWKSWRSRGSA